jgi:hypothetical protein
MSTQARNNIQNTEGYNISFQDNYSTVFTKYILIISEYLKHALDNIYLQNITYRKYVIKKGVTTITHIFSLLLLYTKNLDMVYYNCQKSFVYYIEFIDQIGEDNHSFLQLNSKDAALFIYKKTIFEINNDIRKDYISDDISDKLIKIVNTLITIYNTIIFRLIDNLELIDIIKVVNVDLSKIMQKTIKLYIDSGDINSLNCVLSFITHSNREPILDYLDIFVKKFKKKGAINPYTLEQEILNNDNDKIQNPQKYITTILNNF